MRLAIFGGTGFIGYDFVRLMESCDNVDFTVYSTSAKSLVNLARHDLSVELVSPEALGELELHEDTDFIVNFAHPFGIRNDLTPRRQLEQFIDFVRRQKERIPSLRLVHLSTMSVYEPFEQDIYYPEAQPLRPPRQDVYASDKVFVESQLKRLPGAGQWQLHLRPTIVYGPFCRPWTDRIMEALVDGKLSHRGLSGRIQPVYGHDISRFIQRMLGDFKPGTYNFAGKEEMSWQDFLGFFEALVDSGQLEYDPQAQPQDYGPSVNRWKLFKDSTRELMSAIARHDAFVRMAQPIVQNLPRNFVVWVRDRFFGGSSNVGRPPIARSEFASDFFDEDRLLDCGALHRDFSDFRFTPLSENREILRRYFEFRFTDTPLD